MEHEQSRTLPNTVCFIPCVSSGKGHGPWVASWRQAGQAGHRGASLLVAHGLYVVVMVVVVVDRKSYT